jgi:hypothetical protein
MNDNITSSNVQTVERQDVIHTNASVLIEVTPSLWNNLPPGGDELLEELSVVKE